MWPGHVCVSVTMGLTFDLIRFLFIKYEAAQLWKNVFWAVNQYITMISEDHVTLKTEVMLLKKNWEKLRIMSLDFAILKKKNLRKNENRVVNKIGKSQNYKM